MKEISNTQLKQIEVGILKKFDEICKENNLKYSLFAGSLLGAIRHKGFIPWDDDVDVMMPREDYEKLLALKYEDNDFVIKSYRYTENYYYVFSKMMDKRTHIDEKGRPEKDSGVFIDIFPLDYFDMNKKYQKRAAQTTKVKNFINRITVDAKYRDVKTSTPKYILKRIFHFVIDPFRKSILYKLDTRTINSSGEYCANFTYVDNDKTAVKSSIWDELIYAPFEDINISIIKEYDYFLTVFFGDYMTPPPVDEQVTHHNFIAYYK